MSDFYKIVSFLSVGFFSAFLALKIQSSFVENFSDNLLALLTTLFAINIASITLISGKISELQKQTNHPFRKTRQQLKRSFFEQIGIIAIAFIFGILRDSCLLNSSINSSLRLIFNSVLFFCFFYYLDIIRDIGKSLFDLLDFNNKE